MSISKRTIGLVVASVITIAGIATVTLPTTTHRANDVTVGSQTPDIPVLTGNTPVYPNVTPQTASGSPQKANYNVQTTATTDNQYNGGSVR